MGAKRSHELAERILTISLEFVFRGLVSAVRVHGKGGTLITFCRF